MAITETSPQLRGVVVAAQRYGVHPVTIRRYIAEGRITGFRVGPKLWRVDLRELDQLFGITQADA